jgi:hypothetical protein
MDAGKHMVAVFGCIVCLCIYWRIPDVSLPPAHSLNDLGGQTRQDMGLESSAGTGELYTTQANFSGASLSNTRGWIELIENELGKNDSSRDEASRLLGDWLVAAPDEAIDYVMHATGEEGMSWIKGTLSEYFQKSDGYPGKMKLLARLDAKPGIKEGLPGSALVAWARKDIGAVFEWLERRPDSPDLANAAMALGAFVGESGKARAILEQFKMTSLAPEVKASYLSAVIRNWSGHDLVNAAEWLNHHNNTPEAQRAIPDLVARAAESSAGFAMLWAESIDNEELRAATIIKTAVQWRERDRGGYIEWKRDFVAQDFAWAVVLPVSA